MYHPDKVLFKKDVVLAQQTRGLKHPVNLILAGAMTSDRPVGRVITTVFVNRPAGHEDGGTYPGAWEHSRGVGDSESPLISQPPYPHLSAWTLATEISYPCPGNLRSLHFPGLGSAPQGGETIKK